MSQARVGRRRLRPRDALLPAAAMVLGAAGGLVWQSASPRPTYLITVVGPFPTSETVAGTAVAADGWFAVVATGCGLLLGLLGFGLGRRLAAQLIPLMVASAAMAEFAILIVGQLIANGRVWWVWAPVAGDNHQVRGPLVLHAWGLTVIAPLAGLLVLLLLVTFVPHRSAESHHPVGTGAQNA